MNEEYIRRIRLQLRRQLQFIDNSCRIFDLGCTDEAIRIATSLRVLLHDSGNEPEHQGSILKHLNKKDIRLRTTCDPADKPTGDLSTVHVYDGYLNFPGNMQPWDYYVRGELIQIPVENWWNQVIFILDGQQICRKDLILSAANKDGGAHVDGVLKEEYEAAMHIWNISFQDEHGNIEEAPFTDNHLFALRRFGLEVLHSPELLALIGMTVENVPPV